AALAGTVIIAPHLWWMVDTDFRTIAYAAGQGDGMASTAFFSAIRFLGAAVLYALPAMPLVLLFCRRGDRLASVSPRGWRAFSDTAPGRAPLFAGLGTIMLTVLVGVSIGAPLSSVWVIPSFIFLPILIAAVVSPG